MVPSANSADGVLTFGKTWFALVPYIVLALLITVLTASSSVGMAVALGYYFSELIAVAILINLFDWFQNVADYMLGRNVSAWVIGGETDPLAGEALGGPFRFGEYPGELHAFLVLAAYTLAMAALAFWRFQRRDVAAATAG